MTDRTTEESIQAATQAWLRCREDRHSPPSPSEVWAAALQWQAEQQKGEAVAYLTRDEDGQPAMLFFDPVEAAKYCDEGAEPEALVLSSLPQAPQGERWISVHELLPELNADNEDDGVKVYTWDGEFVTEDVFAPEYEQPAGPAVGGWIRTGDWFCSDTAARVTHWMLRRQPAPPPLAQGDSQ